MVLSGFTTLALHGQSVDATSAFRMQSDSVRELPRDRAPVTVHLVGVGLAQKWLVALACAAMRRCRGFASAMPSARPSFHPRDSRHGGRPSLSEKIPLQNHRRAGPARVIGMAALRELALLMGRRAHQPIPREPKAIDA